MRARRIIEEKAASRIGAETNGGFRSFDHDLGGGTGDGGEQPVQTVFAGDIFDAPGLILLQQFVVALGDAKDRVHRFDPILGDSFFSGHGGEHTMQRFPEAVGFIEKSVRGLRIALRQQEEAGAALRGDNARSLQERYKLIPMKLSRVDGSIDKIERKTACQERIRHGRGRRWHGQDNRLWSLKWLSYS